MLGVALVLDSSMPAVRADAVVHWDVSEGLVWPNSSQPVNNPLWENSHTSHLHARAIRMKWKIFQASTLVPIKHNVAEREIKHIVAVWPLYA